MDYLLFRLYGPLASWGDIAVGESRHSFNGPTKSAVMGLVAAALGIRREEESQHLALNQHYSFATAVWSQGKLLRDYHTVQAPDSVGKFTYRTRRDELVVGVDRLGTVLSGREYRTDALAWVALRPSDDSPYTLEQLALALNKPKFVLYLGRKSCPLAAPLDPQILQANGFSEAFSLYKPRSLTAQRNDPYEFHDNEKVEYNWEGSLECFADKGQLDAENIMTVIQHDKLRSRDRWQFAPRSVHCYRPTEGE